MLNFSHNVERDVTDRFLQKISYRGMTVSHETGEKSKTSKIDWLIDWLVWSHSSYLYLARNGANTSRCEKPVNGFVIGIQLENNSR